MTDITEARTRSDLLKIRRRRDKQLVQARREMHQLRAKVGARTPLGCRLSTAIETIGNCLKAPEDDRGILLQSLAAQLSGIEQHRSGVPLLDTRVRMPHRAIKAA